MTANNTQTSFGTIEMYFSFGVITIASFSLFINLTVFVAGMKVLKKDLHNLLVMLLCFGNGTNGLFAILRSINSLLHEFHTVTSCQFATFGAMYGTFISPFVICMISLERFLMTKALHSGMISMLNSKKHIIITGSLAFPFLVSSSVFAVPNTETCNADGENFKVVLYIIGTTWASVVMVTVVTTILTCVFIWRAINRRKSTAVHPEPTSSTRKSSPPKSKDINVTRVYTEKALLQNKDYKIHPYENRKELQDRSAIEENAKAYKGDTMIRFANLKGLNGNGSKQVNAIADNDESSDSYKTTIDRNKNTALKQTNKGMTWKIRALQTNIIVGATTILFTGPFIVSLLRGLPDETSRLMSGVFYVLCFGNSIVDPFVYIWRVPRIRKQLKTACKYD